MITEVNRAQKVISKELIQTDREKQNIHFESLMIYLLFAEGFISVLKGTLYSP